jgi:hypothetical protein
LVDRLLGAQSAVALHLYKGGGLDPLQVGSRVNHVGLANKSRKKSGTITDSVHGERSALLQRAVRTVDSLDLGSDRPPGQFGAQHMPLPFGGAERNKALTQAKN